MKYLSILVWISVMLYAMDEADVEREIATASSVEELSTKMQEAPKQYRHRYVNAIKKRVSEENEMKRVQMMESLTGKSSGGSTSTTGASSGGKGHGNGNGGGGGNGGGRK